MAADGERFAIYSRRSLADAAGTSHAVQLADCRRYVAERGGVIVAEERDDESGLEVARPGYQRLLALARAGEVDAILIWRFDRFGRDLGEAASRVRELRRLGVRVVSATEGDSNVLRNISLALAEEESERISARVKSAMLHLAATRGIRPRPLFGWRLVPDPESPDPLKPRRMWAVEPDEADLVRAAAARYLAGEPLFAVAEWCRRQVDSRGQPFRTAAGRPISWHLLRSIFGNPAYVGRLVWNREQNSRISGRRPLPQTDHLAADDAVPPILDAGTFARLRREIARRAVNRGQSRRTKRPLTGLLKCGCGLGMYAAQRPRPHREYYKCRAEDRSGCPPGVVPARPLEWAVASAILESAPRVRPVRAKAGAEPDRRPALERALERQRERARRLTLALVDGDIDRDAYREAAAEVERARRALEAELAALPEPAPEPDAAGLAATVAALRGHLGDLTIEERRELFHVGLARAEYRGATVRLEWTPALAAYLGEPGREIVVPRGRKAAAVPEWVDSRVRRRWRAWSAHT